MRNIEAIADISKRIGDAGGVICSLVEGLLATRKSPYTIGPVYEDMILDEIQHIQVLALELTKAATGNVSNIPDVNEAMVVAAATTIGNEMEQMEAELSNNERVMQVEQATVTEPQIITV